MVDPIRHATTADIPALEVIRQQAMEAGFTDTYSRPDFADLIAAPNQQLQKWIGSDDIVVLVGETEITPIGYGAYEPASARVLALYTAPEYQGQGCGRAILDRFEERAANMNHPTLHATVPLNAVEFFERRGFDRQRPTEQDGISMVEMTKPLT